VPLARVVLDGESALLPGTAAVPDARVVEVASTAMMIGAT
jgi:hypothetical protein